MATKVKGDAIKEGSIPLSALSNEVKGKIENASGANWEAKEGEAGYIENKPFAKIPLFGYTFVIDEGNEDNPFGCTNLHYDVKKTASYIKIQFFDSNYGNIIFNKTINLSDAAGSTIETFKNTHLGDFDISLFDYDDNYVLVIGGGYEELWNVSIQSAYQYFNIEEITCLNDLFIPDTVLKTTPQTLSDADKNHALANLGIPRVLNINIYGIEDNLTIDELSEILGDCVTNEILILGLCYRSKYSTVYLPTLHQSYTDVDGRKILNKLVCGQYRVDEDSYDFHLVVCPSVYLYYDEDTQNYRYFLEEY